MRPPRQIAVAVLLAVGATGLGALTLARIGGRSGGPPIAAPDDQQLADLAIGGPFSLVDGAGHSVTQASFPGKWQLIYFGYTTCPDICPTTLQAIAGALASLGPEASRIAPLFITVDPARDTPEVMRRYTGLFDPRIIGLSGTPAQIRAAEKSFRVYAARADRPGTGSYLMDHTSFIYLMDPQGRLQGLYDRNVTADSLAARLRKALA